MAEAPKWRLIFTDSETLSGVAPQCPHQGDHTKHSSGEGYMQPPADEQGVYDCCPGPHIECWSPVSAKVVLQALTETGAEMCS